ncbi:phage portal protein [Alienimonas sp. DA493]|uniref:phage portal protein n=1 Tax=Alienimonas sp. DA493 TaxID=3373605 RepID=UPI0037544D43
MFTLFKDTLAAAALKAKGDRLARERAVALLEGAGRPSAYSLNDAAPTADAGWAEVGTGGASRSAPGRRSAAEIRTAARELAAENPYAKNALRVLEAYVVGPGATLSHARRPAASGVNPGDTDSPAGDTELRAVWSRFWEANGPHVTLNELAVRTWRDGECFVRFFPRAGDVPAARFLDPEEIGPTRERPESLGVLTDPADAVTPVAYLRIDPTNGEHVETIPAAEVLHVKAGADDAEVRGVSVLAPLIAPLTRHAEWLETELTARRVQASVVLWRKVQGNVSAYGDTDGTAGDLAGARADRGVFAPGSILTTPDTTNLEFLAPKTSFAEASRIGRALLLGAAAGVGLPEFMLTADASNANYASTMAAEGPAVKRFAAEQRFFAAALARLWALLARDAVARGVVSEAAVAGLAPEFTFADLAHRDRPAERTADVRLVRAGVLSRAELARREGVDPQRMRREIGAETGE